MTEMLDMTEKLDGFAQRLRELRKQKNLSQTDLGQLAGLHSRTSAATSAARRAHRAIP